MENTVALSTTEGEYVSLSSTAQESLWIRKLNLELGKPPEGLTSILEDNQAVIIMAKNPQFHGRAKHIDIRHYFIREQISDATIKTQVLSYTRDGHR